MHTLTPRQTDIFAFVCKESDEKGRPPSLVEIGKAFRMTPPSVSDHLKAIEAKGYIERNIKERRSMKILRRPIEARIGFVPLLGRIAAGVPLLTQENVEEWVPIHPDFFRPSATFLLRVAGDSMKDVGILTQDLVAIHSQPTAESGQIVAATLLDPVTGERGITLKRLRISPTEVRLESENQQANYLPIVVPQDHRNTADLRIEGIYCGHLHVGVAGAP